MWWWRCGGGQGGVEVELGVVCPALCVSGACGGGGGGGGRGEFR